MTYSTWADLWNNLEHSNPKEFRKEDYFCLVDMILTGLDNRHADLNPLFGFYRDSENLPRLTVCYLKTEEGVAVGLAFCSNGDNPNKHFGKAVAFKRAVRALLGRHTEDEQNKISMDTDFDVFLGEYLCPITVKSYMAPVGYTLKQDMVFSPSTEEGNE